MSDKELPTIKEIAYDFLYDAIDSCKNENLNFKSWEEFVNYSFEGPRLDNVLPGYDYNTDAMAVLANDRFVAADILADHVSAYGMSVNPFSNPTGFLVLAAEEVSYGMQESLEEEFEPLLKNVKESKKDAVKAPSGR